MVDFLPYKGERLNMIDVLSKTISEHPVLTKEQERQLIANDPNWRETIVKHSIKLAYSFAEKYKHCDRAGEIKQEALKGLVEAAQRFNPEKYNVKFCDYAYHWVKKYVQEFIRTEFKHDHMSDDKNVNFTTVHIEDTSFDDESKSRSNEERLDVESAYQSPSSHLESLELSQLLNEILQSDVFKERERAILENRYLRGNKITFRELAESMGCSIPNVKVIETRALEKFRNQLSKFGYNKLKDAEPSKLVD